MTATAPYRCSIAAEARGDLPFATAPPAAQWFLVEHPGPWGRQALGQSGVDPAAAAALSRWATEVGGRVLLVRRAGRAVPADPPVRRWFRVDSRPGSEGVRHGTVAAERELVDVLADDGAGEPSGEPLYLVCAHGRHDTCCAVRGRPVAAALAERYPERTWECSHVGGCRFAANLVLLPHGLYYGPASPSDALRLVQDQADGRVDPRALRGRSSLPPVVQAAQHHARAAMGDTALDALPVLSVAADGSGGSDGSDGGERWTVRLAAAGGELTVRMRTTQHSSGTPLTCAARLPGMIREFELVEPVG